MHRILFVCYGNMCRSPTAHFVFQHMVDERGLSDSFHIDSAGEGYNIGGMAMSHGTIDELVRHRIPFDDTRVSRQFDPYDYELFDYIIAMDDENVESLRDQTGDDPDGKISLLLSFAGEDREIDTPGVGTKDQDPAYLAQYSGLTALNNAADIKKENADLASGGTFAFISGASVSGQAIHSGVAAALSQYAAMGGAQ